MTPELQRLVREMIELTGSDAPELLGADAPVLTPDALDDDEFYLVGLIGGKEVGKSSLVNALVGNRVSEATSYGPGTQSVIAYAHDSAAQRLRALLGRAVPDRFRIVTHQQPHLRRQVLLDLPDIDSRYSEHLQITRAMLRHMLYPLWLQSIEKYADQQPQKLLAMVAEGNDPANFLFCLNKVDQLERREGAEAVAQVKDDFAGRIARTLELSAPPRVFAVSAANPGVGDFASLREMLAQEKSSRSVRAAQDLALRRQDRSLLAWIDRQHLPRRIEALARLQREADELAAERIASPILERGIPRWMDDPAYRIALVEPVMRKRIARWPIVNIVDALLSPVMSLVKANLSAAPASAGVGLDAHLKQDGRGIASLVQATFAQLYRTSPLVPSLYVDRKLWEDMPAETSAEALDHRINAAVQNQRQVVVDRVAGRYGIISPLLRWLLTIGALLWFPFVQPVLQVLLAGGFTTTVWEAARLAVELLGVTYLLKNVTFLLIWYIALWAILRWQTQNRVERFIERWKASIDPDDPLSMSGQAMAWLGELTEPIRMQRLRVETISQQVEAIRAQLQQPRESAAA